MLSRLGSLLAFAMVKEGLHLRGKPAACPRRSQAVVEVSSGESDEVAADQQGEDGGFCCYLLASVTRRRAYTGITTDLSRRLRQHNGELRGGAKATRAGGPWQVVCVVQGFPSKVDACQFEWRAKRQIAVQSKKLIPMQGGLERRCANLLRVLCLDRWTKESRPAAEMPLQVTWFGGAPWQSTAELPTYITIKCVEGNFEAKRPKRQREDSKEFSEKSLLPAQLARGFSMIWELLHIAKMCDRQSSFLSNLILIKFW
ncbi:unnamed protein product [Durusdinium trenchii]|uniref:Uncharacterized protein n=2 Tax=Durusdinium trenchii TaxID=1381693 RepID=A0ABP0QBX1_9DINO